MVSALKAYLTTAQPGDATKFQVALFPPCSSSVVCGFKFTPTTLKCMSFAPEPQRRPFSAPTVMSESDPLATTSATAKDDVDAILAALAPSGIEAEYFASQEYHEWFYRQHERNPRLPLPTYAGRRFGVDAPTPSEESFLQLSRTAAARAAARREKTVHLRSQLESTQLHPKIEHHVDVMENLVSPTREPEAPDLIVGPPLTDLSVRKERQVAAARSIQSAMRRFMQVSRAQRTLAVLHLVQVLQRHAASEAQQNGGDAKSRRKTGALFANMAKSGLKLPRQVTKFLSRLPPVEQAGRSAAVECFWLVSEPSTTTEACGPTTLQIYFAQCVLEYEYQLQVNNYANATFWAEHGERLTKQAKDRDLPVSVFMPKRRCVLASDEMKELFATIATNAESFSIDDFAPLKALLVPPPGFQAITTQSAGVKTEVFSKVSQKENLRIVYAITGARPTLFPADYEVPDVFRKRTRSISTSSSSATNSDTNKENAVPARSAPTPPSSSSTSSADQVPPTETKRVTKMPGPKLDKFLDQRPMDDEEKEKKTLASIISAMTGEAEEDGRPKNLQKILKEAHASWFTGVTEEQLKAAIARGDDDFALSQAPSMPEGFIPPEVDLSTATGFQWPEKPKSKPSVNPADDSSSDASDLDAIEWGDDSDAEEERLQAARAERAANCDVYTAPDEDHQHTSQFNPAAWGMEGDVDAEVVAGQAGVHAPSSEAGDSHCSSEDPTRFHLTTVMLPSSGTGQKECVICELDDIDCTRCHKCGNSVHRTCGWDHPTDERIIFCTTRCLNTR